MLKASNAKNKKRRLEASRTKNQTLFKKALLKNTAQNQLKDKVQMTSGITENKHKCCHHNINYRRTSNRMFCEDEVFYIWATQY
jgi:hypothetical protein